jgi:hypothetical protein
MFDRFDDAARTIVVQAQHEARLLGHDEIGDDHLLLGVASTAPEIVGVPVEALRARVRAARTGAGDGIGGSAGQIPFTPHAKAALDWAGQEALAQGNAAVTPADVLAAVVRVNGRAADVLTRVGVDSMAEELLAIGPDSTAFADDPPVTPAGPSPTVIERLAQEGEAIMASLIDTPVGDVGHPRTDARLLLAILAVGGPIAEYLRECGVDAAAIHSLVPELDADAEGEGEGD